MTWSPPDAWLRLTTLDAHTAGEPLRIVTGGWPDPPGDTILARRAHAARHQDHLRRALMLEPRGHADMYGALPLPPATPDGDLGVLFLHNEGYSTMCGHGIIGLVSAGLEAGLFPLPDDGLVRLDTPAGRVLARPERVDGRVRSVSFRNVPSFLLERDLAVDVPGLGRVVCDLGYGGAFYAYVDAAGVDLELVPARFAEIVAKGMAIKRAVEAAHPPVHPDGDPDLNFLYGTIFVEHPGDGCHSRNVCVFAEGEVDRSPTGTGVSGRVAVHHARGELALGEELVIESLLGTRFAVTAVEATTLGGLPAVVPEVRGSAHITGRHEFLVDPDDPLADGVLLR